LSAALYHFKRLTIKDSAFGEGTLLAQFGQSTGRLVVAAYGDGTIRWHRMDTGNELLAFRALPDSFNWVAWTPQGYFGATPGAFGVLRWAVNRGFDSAGSTVPVSAIPKLRRPEVLGLVLKELDITRALGRADLKAARREEVDSSTRSKIAPHALRRQSEGLEVAVC
jgi:hypothetical protein